MQYSILYKPDHNKSSPWLLEIWEPSLTSLGGQDLTPYLYKARYWLKSQFEAQIKVAEYQEMQQGVAIAA